MFYYVSLEAAVIGKVGLAELHHSMGVGESKALGGNVGEAASNSVLRTCAMLADILEAPGSNHLIVTHKSMMRAFLCTALALPPTSFRAVDIHNGGVSIFK